eukprot:scaffold40271_cov63-Phaeocystis_antarctica.AAC.2
MGRWGAEAEAWPQVLRAGARGGRPGRQRCWAPRASVGFAAAASRSHPTSRPPRRCPARSPAAVGRGSAAEESKAVKSVVAGHPPSG